MWAVSFSLAADRPLTRLKSQITYSRREWPSQLHHGIGRMGPGHDDGDFPPRSIWPRGRTPSSQSKLPTDIIVQSTRLHASDLIGARFGGRYQWPSYIQRSVTLVSTSS